MGYIGETDQAILNYTEHLPSELSPLMNIITGAGSPVACVLILLAVIAYFYFGNFKRLYLTALVLLFAMPVAPLLKALIRRVRPDNEYVRNMIFQTYSFPSGHAYSSFLVFGFLVFLAWRYMKPSYKLPVISGLVLSIILVGLSRVYLGAHFPSDVVAGWLLAAAILFISTRLATVKGAPNSKPKQSGLSGRS